MAWRWSVWSGASGLRSRCINKSRLRICILYNLQYSTIPARPEETLVPPSHILQIVSHLHFTFFFTFTRRLKVTFFWLPPTRVDSTGSIISVCPLILLSFQVPHLSKTVFIYLLAKPRRVWWIKKLNILSIISYKNQKGTFKKSFKGILLILGSYMSVSKIHKIFFPKFGKW